MKTSKIALLDTNILVYAHQGQSEFHKQANTLINKGFIGEINLCLCPQVLFEFFAVITNPKRVIEPFSPKEALKEIVKYVRSENIEKIYPKENLLEISMDLLKKYDVKGIEVFDLKLASTMLSNCITSIYTFNTSDFLRFSEIEVLTP